MPLHPRICNRTHQRPVGSLSRQKDGKMQVALNTRVSIKIAKALDGYAKATGKSKASIVQDALQEYLERHGEVTQDENA